jgi:hypothetical protein
MALPSKAWMVVAALTAMGLSACTTTQQVAHNEFRPPQGSYTLIVMQPDISVGVLTAGGLVEPREEWTEQARRNVINALMSQQGRRGGQTKVAATREETGADPALVSDLLDLHNAVGASIKLHKFTMFTLPTKRDRFDWTLGHRAVEFGASTSYDYALFLHAQDSFSSGGRVALQIAGALACGFGVCVMPTGGVQVAFASLVDLKTGQVIWFNTLASSVGDIRTPEGASEMVKKLLDSMKPGADAKTAGRT